MKRPNAPVSVPAFDELLVRLVRADVRFVVIGGLALGSWGVVRGTKDCDIVPDPDPGNLDRLAALAAELGGSALAAGAGSASDGILSADVSSEAVVPAGEESRP